MTWLETIQKADQAMTLKAGETGKARLQINYYADRNGVVRKVLEMGGLETKEEYDKGVDEDFKLDPRISTDEGAT